MIDDFKPVTASQRVRSRRLQSPQVAQPAETLPSTDSSTAVAEDKTVANSPVDVAPMDARTPNTEQPHASRWAFLKPPYSKKQKIFGSLAIVVVFFGLGAGWTLTHHKRAVTAETPVHSQPKKVAPKIIYSSLSGLPVADNSVNQRPVTAVMVENSIDARPQSGLSQAGIVYEAVAEGGVTRFMALYQDQVPTNVGPIRSARPYYVQWALGYDAAYAHVGGSADALSDITAWGVHDLNQFYNGGSYHRVSSRAAPHNVYTGIDTLNQLESSKGYGASNYTGFSRKSDQPYKAPTATQQGAKTATDSRIPASSIDFSLSGYTYDPHYDYDASTNTYNRSEAGESQTDANSGAQLSPKVVVAIAVPLTQGALDASGAYYSNYNVIGSGQAWVFQDGTVSQATWSKSDNTAPLSLTDSTGKSFVLNRGQTWISAVTGSNKVQYK